MGLAEFWASFGEAYDSATDTSGASGEVFDDSKGGAIEALIDSLSEGTSEVWGWATGDDGIWDYYTNVIHPDAHSGFSGILGIYGSDAGDSEAASSDDSDDDSDSTSSSDFLLWGGVGLAAAVGLYLLVR